MKKKLFIKYLNNTCTEHELTKVLKWIKVDALNEEGKKLSFEDWNSFEGKSNLKNDEKFTTLFNKIEERIDRKTKERRATFILPVLMKWITKAAAVLLFPVLAFLFYVLSETKIESNKYASMALDSLEVIAPIGSRTVVQLSDGSEVYLNYGSKIKYPYFFSDDAREVVLSGEGYFNVSHNPNKPFIVRTEKLNINAVGTSFNVLAYPDMSSVETTLVTGEVILDQINSDGIIKTIGSMTPGQHVVYNMTTSLITSTEGNIEEFIAWKDGKLIFDDTPLIQVTEKLSKKFNVDFEIATDVTDYIYTVTLTDETISQILDLMVIASPIVYKKLPRKELSDGTFSKQRIIIEKQK